METKFLIKLGSTFTNRRSSDLNLNVMQELNPIDARMRFPKRLCNRPALMYLSIGLNVPDYNQDSLKRNNLALKDGGYYQDRLVK